MYINHKSILENSIFQNAIYYFIFRNFCFTSRSIANILTFIVDIIARVLKTFSATQAVVLDISKTFRESGITVFFTNLGLQIWRYEKVFCLIESFRSSKIL